LETQLAQYNDLFTAEEQAALSDHDVKTTDMVGLQVRSNILTRMLLRNWQSKLQLDRNSPFLHDPVVVDRMREVVSGVAHEFVFNPSLIALTPNSENGQEIVADGDFASEKLKLSTKLAESYFASLGKLGESTTEGFIYTIESLRPNERELEFLRAGFRKISSGQSEEVEKRRTIYTTYIYPTIDGEPLSYLITFEELGGDLPHYFWRSMRYMPQSGSTLDLSSMSVTRPREHSSKNAHATFEFALADGSEPFHIPIPFSSPGYDDNFDTLNEEDKIDTLPDFDFIFFDAVNPAKYPPTSGRLHYLTYSPDIGTVTENERECLYIYNAFFEAPLQPELTPGNRINYFIEASSKYPYKPSLLLHNSTHNARLPELLKGKTEGSIYLQRERIENIYGMYFRDDLDIGFKLNDPSFDINQYIRSSGEKLLYRTGFRTSVDTDGNMNTELVIYSVKGLTADVEVTSTPVTIVERTIQ
jgi:hypothetical protein